MIKKELVQKTVEEIVSIQCDRCCVDIPTDNTLEIQEMLNLNFVAGYGSDLGDGNQCELDLCQKCVKELLGPFMHITQNSPTFILKKWLWKWPFNCSFSRSPYR